MSYNQLPCPISTQWADKINPNNPLPEYPRPQLVRDTWRSLNGLWDYKIQTKSTTAAGVIPTENHDGEILVPFAVETALSGVGRPLLPSEQLIYHRNFSIPDDWAGKRVLLHFEALDYKCECLVNRKRAGAHRGGYLPFCFDITDLLAEDENELVLIVTDPTNGGMQQRGKQSLNPGTGSYSATSGIWQTVWLEAVSLENYIRGIGIAADSDNSNVIFKLDTLSNMETAIKISLKGRVVAEASGMSSWDLTAVIVSPELWTPDNPVLYDVDIKLLDGAMEIDSVLSYFAFRKIEIKADSTGCRRIFLNGRAVFLNGLLDQGCWPESGMTPPSDAAMIFDIKKTRELGFNSVRKHLKIESRRWYYHADRLGLMVMQDGVSGGRHMFSLPKIWLARGADKQHGSDSKPAAYRRAGRASPENRAEFENDLELMIGHLFNHPSVVMWIPFNEGWGQFDSVRIAEKIRGLDPTRLIDPASGWLDRRKGDFRSRHTYSINLKHPPKSDKRVYFISEYGGCNLQVAGHLWNNRKKFGYKTVSDSSALIRLYTRLIRGQLIPLVKEGLGAAVYTQFSDVEIETNGIFTFDRRIQKIPTDIVHALNNEIYKELN